MDNRLSFFAAAGQQLINVRGACPKEVVQPKCDELTRVRDIVTERLTRRLEILLKSRDLMERVEKVRSQRLLAGARAPRPQAFNKSPECRLSRQSNKHKHTTGIYQIAHLIFVDCRRINGVPEVWNYWRRSASNGAPCRAITPSRSCMRCNNSYCRPVIFV